MGAVAAQAACKGRAQLKARAERTQNMLVMSVTLDVSNIRCWSNAIVPVGERPLRAVVTLDMPTPSGWLNADAPENMLPMLMTLEVSKLSGWLNAEAR